MRAVCAVCLDFIAAPPGKYTRSPDEAGQDAAVSDVLNVRPVGQVGQAFVLIFAHRTPPKNT
jgi:hypothetical protein